MKEKLNKKQAEERINEFFKGIESKSPEQVRKLKSLAMKFNIKLKDKRKRFCKYCYSPKLKVKSVKRGVKAVECQNCKKLMRWKIF